MDHFPPHMEQIIAAPRKKPKIIPTFAIGERFRLEFVQNIRIEDTEFTIYPGIWISFLDKIQGVEHIVIQRLK